MTVWTLRVRAVLWASISAIANALPWTRTYCGLGRPTDTAAACAAAVTVGCLVVIELRRSHGGSSAYTTARGAQYWPLLAVGACGEELLFRGLMLRVLASTWGVWPGILFASAAFGAAHRRPGRTRDIVIHVFTGLILGVLAWLTGGWLASAAAHAAYNCVVVEWRPQAMITREPGAPSISHNRVMSPGRAGDWS